MNPSNSAKPFVAIACGGTGGHLFPGLAVAAQLKARGCDVVLLISPKEVDQAAVKSAPEMPTLTLPAVGLQNRNYFSFARSFWHSWRAVCRYFKERRPDGVLAMGGFTSAPPIFAARSLGASTFLHESNTIPGKANRFLARYVDEAFIGFSETAARLKARKTTVTGTPVRGQFAEVSSRTMQCRIALGLDPVRPTILVVGGSQGASGLNEMILSSLPLLAGRPWQWLHLTGANDAIKVRAAYAHCGIKAVVKPFFAEMELALGAATAAVSRAGASSLAEIAALRLPSLLVPFPAAADNHQFFNARALVATGAARLLEQKQSTSDQVAAQLTALVEDERVRLPMQSALGQWDAPKAAERIASIMLETIVASRARSGLKTSGDRYGAGQPAEGAQQVTG
jgi:UDP-N-acetylglucosamine--N-acetylmuramyl-(pentapeptide) pyrophosphoryl-undecaprenol N-acetylglucosamine transferase